LTFYHLHHTFAGQPIMAEAILVMRKELVGHKHLSMMWSYAPRMQGHKQAVRPVLNGGGENRSGTFRYIRLPEKSALKYAGLKSMEG